MPKHLRYPHEQNGMRLTRHQSMPRPSGGKRYYTRTPKPVTYWRVALAADGTLMASFDRLKDALRFVSGEP